MTTKTQPQGPRRPIQVLYAPTAKELALRARIRSTEEAVVSDGKDGALLVWQHGKPLARIVPANVHADSADLVANAGGSLVAAVRGWLLQQMTEAPADGSGEAEAMETEKSGEEGAEGKGGKEALKRRIQWLEATVGADEEAIEAARLALTAAQERKAYDHAALSEAKLALERAQPLGKYARDLLASLRDGPKSVQTERPTAKWNNAGGKPVKTREGTLVVELYALGFLSFVKRTTSLDRSAEVAITDLGRQKLAEGEAKASKKRTRAKL